MNGTSWSLAREAETSHGRIAWDRFGEGPALVFVHGTPFSSFIWRRIAHSLSARFTVHLFDLLGYGQSQKADEVSLAVQNGVLRELLGQWGLARPLMVAHDFGGATALRAHLIDGCDYERLILIDAVVLRPWGSPFVTHVRQHEQAFAGMPAAMHAALLRAYIQSAALRPLSLEAMDGHCRPWESEEGQAAFYRQIAQMDQTFTMEIEERLAEVRCPVSIVWGEEDRWLPFEQSRRLAEALGGAPVTPVAGAGHMVQEDAPEAIVHEILLRMTGKTLPDGP